MTAALMARRLGKRQAKPSSFLPAIARPAPKGLAFRRKGSIGVGDRRGAASARDPTAPSALADPGLVLVRGPIFGPPG